MTRKHAEESRQRGGFVEEIPGLSPLVLAAEERTGIPPAVSGPLSVGAHWLLLYSCDPWRVRFPMAKHPGWRTLPAASAMLVSPWNNYEIDTRGSGGTAHHRWVILAMPAPSLYAHVGAHADGVVLYRDEAGVLGEAMRAMVDVVEAGRAQAFWPLQLASRRLLALLLAAPPGEDGGRVVREAREAPRPDPIVIRVIAYLGTHVEQAVRLADVAAAVHASVSTVAHRYRAYAGEGPMETLRRMRLQRARMLLLEGRRTRDIAEQLGFCDERYFSSAFRREIGVSPRAFVARTRAALPVPVPGAARDGVATPAWQRKTD